MIKTASIFLKAMLIEFIVPESISTILAHQTKGVYRKKYGGSHPSLILRPAENVCSI